MDHPTARTTGLLRERVGDEIVVLDEQSGVAHCLSPAIAAVWDACDGTSDEAAIVGSTGLGADVVSAALVELEALELLAGTPIEEQDTTDVDGLSRRDALGRMAKRAAIATSVPLAYSLAVGTPANADSISCAQNACSTLFGNTQCSGGFIFNTAPGCKTNSRCVNGRCVF